MDKAKARQAPHNVAVLVLPECGAVPGDRGGMQLEQAGAAFRNTQRQDVRIRWRAGKRSGGI